MKKLISFLTINLVLIMISNISAQQSERKDVPDKYKWDNTILYKNVDEWQKDRQSIENQLNKLKQFNGKLGESADNLYSALRLYMDITKSYYKLADYAGRLSDEDLRNSANQSLNQQQTTLGTKFGEASAFINPEILKLDPDKVKKFFEEKKELIEFRFFVNEILRLRNSCKRRIDYFYYK